jgi:hypothetical protein
MYNCPICEYNSSLKANVMRHCVSKHKNIECNIIQNKPAAAHNTEDTMALKAEILALKAEIETLKAKHETDLIKLKLSMYENQTIKPNRKSISPAKSEPDVIPKKRHNENTLEYLNKHYPPMEQENDLITVLCEKLSWKDIELSTVNIENQYVSILRPLIEKYKMIYSSGDKCHTPKLYYIIENEWREILDNLNFVCYYIYTYKIKDAIEEALNAKKFNSDEHGEIICHYAQNQSQTNIVKQLLDVMRIPVKEMTES